MELLLYPWESYLERYILQISHRKTVIEINRPTRYLLNHRMLYSLTSDYFRLRFFLFELFRANFLVTQQKREAVSQTQYISGVCT